MGFVNVAVLVLSAATGIVVLSIDGVRALAGRRRRGWLRRTIVWTLASVPVHALVTLPAALGYLGSRLVETRRDERAYAGPRIAADGGWIFQSRESLRAEADRMVAVDPALARAAADRAVQFVASDGTPLRAFVVPPRVEPPRATVVMVHGLFRGALELEPVGSMFRDLGCEVILLELRNHGGSGRAPATFGIREAEDVLAAVAWARARSAADASRKLALFGVSLGTAAVGFAAPRVPELGGVVVDAPLTDAVATAERMLADGPRGRARFAIPRPILGLTMFALELWSGFDLADDRPGDALMLVPATVPILVIGAGDDRRMPPDEVTALYDALPQRAPHKQLWICDGADHGHVWVVDGDGYRERLAAFVELLAPR